MRRKELSTEGVDVKGVGLVPVESVKPQRWLRRKANDLIIAAEGSAAAGLLLKAYEASYGVVNSGGSGGLITGKTVDLFISAVGVGSLIIDAGDRALHRKGNEEPLLVTPPRGVPMEGGGLLPPPEPSGTGSNMLHYARTAAAVIGLPVLTAAAIRSGNIPEAVLTGAAETLIVANFHRGPGIIRRFYGDRDKYHQKKNTRKGN